MPHEKCDKSYRASSTSSVRSGTINRLKSRSSIRWCKEHYTCSGDTEASVHCHTCGSDQCATCAEKLHCSEKEKSHKLVILQPINFSELCQLKNCTSRNFADFFCIDCELRYCVSCCNSSHKSLAKKHHSRLHFSTYQAEEQLKLARVVSEAHEIQKEDNEFSDEFLSLSPTVEISFSSKLHDLESSNLIKPSSSVAVTRQPGTASVMHQQYNDNELAPSVQDQPRVNPRLNTNAEKCKTIDSDYLPSIGESFKSDNDVYEAIKSYLLIDANEKIQVSGVDEFVSKLQCDKLQLMKVVSIFGNTGDGKSHTLNHTFFGSAQVFATSASQLPGTAGVWMAFDHSLHALILDTEGLLGISANSNQRTRLLLKILALSDVVIYRTRAERLHNDLFTFLSDASNAYSKHFHRELLNACQRLGVELPLGALGPSVVIFHETQHTSTLSEHCSDVHVALAERFRALKLSLPEAFSSIHYVGVRTTSPPTSFEPLAAAVRSHLRNSEVRAPRSSAVLLQALQILNEKFSGEIEVREASAFPDQYFTCTARCLCCESRCTLSMNHSQEGEDHRSTSLCKYEAERDNKVYLCNTCYSTGREQLVVPKATSAQDSTWLGLMRYAWSGFVLECPTCGVIYRAREFWMGNLDPEKACAVRSEIRHLWPGAIGVLQGTHNAGQRILDGVGLMGDFVGAIIPTRVVGEWISDNVAPSYWVPNSSIKSCHSCGESFGEADRKHHCRSCGQGFCSSCTNHRRPVPERGWGAVPVRVCNDCFKNENFDGHNSPDVESHSGCTVPSKCTGEEPTARRLVEVVAGTMGVVATAVNFSAELVKDVARPAYWVPDAQIQNCSICSFQFDGERSDKLSKRHHCRACGRGVCESCSPARRPVPSRGWDHAVRVCNECAEHSDQL